MSAHRRLLSPKVTFNEQVLVWVFDDLGYDRSIMPMCILSREEKLHMLHLRKCMLHGYFIGDTHQLIQDPLPARSMYFQAFLNSWKKREKHASLEAYGYLVSKNLIN